MSIVTYNNRSIANISAIPGAAKSLTHIKTLTASSDSTIDFKDGTSSVVLDNTYPAYMFKIINMNPATTNAIFEFQGNASGGSGFNETITSSSFRAYHTESDSAAVLTYLVNDDLAQGTDYQHLANGVGNGSDESLCLELFLFNPSSTTFVKHFIIRTCGVTNNPAAFDSYVAGYFNVTAAIDGIQFSMSSGNIDSGTIKLYGVV